MVDRSTRFIPKAASSCGGNRAINWFIKAAWSAKAGKMERKKITIAATEIDHMMIDLARTRNSCM
jgi:hypothetical protein